MYREGRLGPMCGSGCRCGSGRSHDDCCGPIIEGTRPAPTAEALMRSRFTAFALGDHEYLRRSWASGKRPPQVRTEPARRWTSLEIVELVDGRELASTGVVEFRAHYELDGVSGVVHERSNFARESGRWVYVDGTAGEATDG